MDGRDESVAAPGQGLDETRRIGGIAQRRSDLRDAKVEAAFEVDERAVVPDLLPQIVAGDDLARMSEEDGQNARRLRLQANRHALAAEQTRGGIELEKAEPHSSVHVLTIALPYAAPSGALASRRPNAPRFVACSRLVLPALTNTQGWLPRSPSSGASSWRLDSWPIRRRSATSTPT